MCVSHTHKRALSLSISLPISPFLSIPLSLSHMVEWRVVPIVATICWALFVIEEVEQTASEI